MSDEAFGRELDSRRYWSDEAERYRRQVGGERGAYHDGRLAVARRLLERAALAPGARVLDFGCGDGVLLEDLAQRGARVDGLDAAAPMIELARARLAAAGVEPGRLEVGSAEALAGYEDAELDGIVSVNVLAYLTADEERTFYDQAARVLRPGGMLLVSHSNELFDLYALNGGTAAFFARHLLPPGATVAPLLTRAGDGGTGYNVRANPLSYPAELRERGFEEAEQAFFNLHPQPPALLGPGDEGRIFDPNAIEALPHWRQQLQCSTYFSLSRRG